MTTNQPTRGFVTVATGKLRYYELAYNLLLSYKKHTRQPLPFCIVAEEENEFTQYFDKVILLKNSTHSYIDKLSIFADPPFDQNIFIDADCLAYGDLNDFFTIMPEYGISCIGHHLPLDNTTDGFFAYDGVGEYKNRLTFIPDMHGGVIWFNKDTLTKRIYNECLEIIPKYSNYKFRYFAQPADEPILALAIAINGGKMIELSQQPDLHDFFVFRPSVKHIKQDIHKGILTVYRKHICIENVRLCHWQNYNCNRYEYKNAVISLKRPVNGLGLADYVAMASNYILDKLYDFEIFIKVSIAKLLR